MHLTFSCDIREQKLFIDSFESGNPHSENQYFLTFQLMYQKNRLF